LFLLFVFLCFFFYGACGFLIKVLGSVLFLNNEKLYTSVRQVCLVEEFYLERKIRRSNLFFLKSISFQVNPIIMVLLPIYSIHRLKHYRLNRDRDIRSIMMIESGGLTGTKNYEDIISRAWEHIRNREFRELRTRTQYSSCGI
uniref:PHM7_cyt domain-containing protein n=1 Tax=Angiostrongylus cantonensis TaxID=6313 RepID=A0A0K0CX43_ANGCA